MSDKSIAIIGAGNMGGAIARRIIGAKLFRGENVVVSDLIPEKARVLGHELGLRVVPSASDATRAASLVLIAVKPQNMKECLEECKQAVNSSHLMISIAAGITTRFIEDSLVNNVRVIRVMPNTPALVGAGVSALCAGAHAAPKDLEEAEKIFAVLGKVYRVHESLMDAVTAVSGSGPAYLFFFAECLERAALEIGLPEKDAADIVAQTLYGAAKLLVESDQTAAALRAQVASPGGTTQAALNVLTGCDFEEDIVAAVGRAHARARELGGMKAN